jgi:hypothetical protein
MPNVIHLGELRRDFLGSWSAEAVIAPERPSDPSIIVEHATTIPVDKVLKTWFKPDVSLSHISGGLD